MYRLDKEIIFYGLKCVFFCTCLLCAFSPLHGQEASEVILQCKSDVSSEAFLKTFYPSLLSFPDSSKAASSAFALLNELHKQGYLASSIKELRLSNDTLNVFYEVSLLFIWDYLGKGNLPASLLQKFGKQILFEPSSPFSYERLQKAQELLLDYASENGYPFASVRLDSFQMQENRVSAVWQYAAGPPVVFDSLRLPDGLKVSPAFLQKYLGIRKNTPYNKKKVDRILPLLRQLPYLKTEKPVRTSFEGDRAFVYPNVRYQKNSSIDGVLGFLPNEEKPDALLLTGEINLRLLNLFASGKSLLLQWQSLRTDTRLIDLHYAHPLFLGLPLELKLHFYLLREDSTFLNTRQEAGILYKTSLYSELYAGLRLNRGRSGAGLLFSRLAELPSVADIDRTSYDLQYTYRRLDRYFLPTQGLDFSVRFGVGEKNIIANPLLADSLYTGLRFRSIQADIFIKVSYYQSLSKRSCLYTRVEAGALWNEQLFLNELYRLGGLTQLRGHNQNAFFASQYLSTTLEYRLFFEEEAYFSVFYDQAVLRKNLFTEPMSEDRPAGIGVGISFTTGSGLFNLIYALGASRQEGGFNFSRSKIHFGFVGRF